MPLRLTVYRPDRLVIGVATEVLTVADLSTFLHQIGEGEIHHFRKIVDVSGARPEIMPQELKQFGEELRAALQDTPRGAMAIVASDKTNDLARLFSTITGDGRPAEVFRSIHDARKWLNASSFPR